MLVGGLIDQRRVGCIMRVGGSNDRRRVGCIMLVGGSIDRCARVGHLWVQISLMGAWLV